MYKVDREAPGRELRRRRQKNVPRTEGSAVAKRRLEWELFLGSVYSEPGKNSFNVAGTSQALLGGARRGEAVRSAGRCSARRWHLWVRSVGVRT